MTTTAKLLKILLVVGVVGVVVRIYLCRRTNGFEIEAVTLISEVKTARVRIFEKHSINQNSTSEYQRANIEFFDEHNFMQNSKPINIKSARRRLARQISEILANPACPASLHNAITDELTFYAELADYTRPHIVELSLSAYDETREVLDAESDEINEIGRERTDRPN